MDPRVRTVADSMWDCEDPIAVHFAEDAIAALEAEGYSVVKLEQAFPNGKPPISGYYRIVESGNPHTLAESGNGDTARHAEGGEPR